MTNPALIPTDPPDAYAASGARYADPAPPAGETSEPSPFAAYLAATQATALGAAPGSRADAARRPAGGRFEMLGTALFLLPITFVGVAVFSILITGISLATLWIGIPIAMAMMYFTRHFTDLHRLWFGRRFGVRIDRPYRDLPDAHGPIGHVKRFFAMLGDPQTWRDQAWLLVNATVGVAFLSTVIAMFFTGLGSLTMGAWWNLLPAGAEFETFGIPGVMTVYDSASAFIYGVPAGIVYLLLWWLVTPVLFRAYLQITRALLGPADVTERLAERVRRLNETL